MITASFFTVYRFTQIVSNKFSSLVIQQPRLTCKFESEKKKSFVGRVELCHGTQSQTTVCKSMG